MSTADRRSLTWSTKHNYGANTLAHQFPNLQISAQDAASGAVRVEARSPSGRVMDMGVGEVNGVYTANFTPTEVGDWNISILYEGQHIQGSPFNVRVYDAAQVKVFGLEGGSVGKEFSFSIDCSQAGDGELTVDITHNGRSIPGSIQSEGRGIYRACFLPQGPGVYTIRVYFAGMEVQGSPYTLEIVDSSSVTASGEGLSAVEVNKKAVFIVNAHGASGDNIKVNVTSPRGTHVPCQVFNQGDGTFRVEYSVQEVGEYVIDVFYYGKPIQGSPFRVNAFDWNRITVHNLKSSGLVGRMVEFDIDASHAGSGNLEIMVNDGTIPCSVQNRGNRQFHGSFMPKEPITHLIQMKFNGRLLRVDAAHAGSGNLEIMVNEGTIPCSVQNRGNRQFHASFMPKDAMPHLIQMKFNGREVPGSPWRVDIRGVAHVTCSGQGLQLTQARQPAVFEIRAGPGAPNDAQIHVAVTSPSQRMVPVQVINQYNGVYRCEYIPHEVGNHLIDVQYEGVAVGHSPYTAKCYDPSSIRVSGIGSGMIGRPVEFEIDVTQAGEGQLEIMVNRGSVPNTVKMARKGVFLVSFVPHDARVHIVDIKFNGELIPRCPIQVPILDTSRVTVQGDGLRQVAVNRSSHFRVNTHLAGDADLQVRVTAPSGRAIPVNVEGTPLAGYQVDYHSNEIGTHRIDVDYAGSPIPGSPFFATSFDSSKVAVRGIRDAVVGTRTSFTVDVNDAGEGNMEISITGPGGRNIQNQVQQVGPGQFEVSYTPMEEGRHTASVTFNSEHVPGGPFHFRVLDASRVTASGDGLSSVRCGTPARFVINAPGAHVNDLDVKIIAPNGQEVIPGLRDIGGGQVQVEWTPSEVGEYRVDVAYHGLQIPGSPFTARAWDASKVVVSGVKTGRISKPYFFHIDASRAGAGNLEIIVSAANDNVPNFVKAEGNARFEVSFTPQVPETHLISVKFNGDTVPGSVFMADMIGRGKTHSLGGGVIRTPLGTPAIVHIDPRKAGAIAETAIVEVIAPSDRMLRARVEPADGGRLRAEFTPIEVGPHCINVTVGDILLPGSPFAFAVYDIRQIYISKLRRGAVGKNYEFEVDASRAGLGDVEVTVQARNKKIPAKMTRAGNDVYHVTFMPKDAVRHLVYVTFSKETVPGSPFYVEMEDATRVAATGRCLEASPVNKMAEFNIDATRALFKANAFIKITGPPPHRSDVPYRMSGSYISGWKVEWMPTELGVYTIDVKYGDKHVVGSPFRCRVYDLTKVRLYRDELSEHVDLDGIPGEDIVFFVDASEAGAGNLEIVVKCANTGQRIPNYLEGVEDQPGKFRIYFTPKASCFRYTVDATFNDEHIMGSPFGCSIVDGSRATASGDGLRLVPINTAAFFDVNTNGVGDATLDVDIRAPSGAVVPAEVTGNFSSGFRVQYNPIEVGRHKISVRYADVDVSGGPFYAEVYDMRQVRVGNIPDGVVGQPVHFDVDCSNAGEGTLTVDVRGQQTTAFTEIQPKGNNFFDVAFTPQENVPHQIHVTFNQQVVPGSPFTCNLFDTSSVHIDWESVRTVPVLKPASFIVTLSSGSAAAVSVKITDPQGAECPARVIPMDPQHARVEFTPRDVGGHLIGVQYGGQNVVGSPFTAYTYDASRIRITDVDPAGAVGKDMGFTVDTSQAGQGDIDVEVTCAGQMVRTARTKLDAYRHRFTFVPTARDFHLVNVNFNYDQVPGCPLRLAVSDPSGMLMMSGESMTRGVVEQPAYGIVQTRGAVIDIAQVQTKVTAPNGELVPAKIVQQPDADYKVEYSSKYTGRHTVEILYAGQAIMGSPFYVEIYDPNKIRVEGVKSGMVGESIGFDIVRNEAGKAELGLTITAPSGRNVVYEMSPTAKGDHVTYIPQEPGPHHIYITYGGLEVPGCPLTQTIGDSGSANAFGDGLLKGEEDKTSTFFVDTQGRRGDLKVNVEGPNSVAKVMTEVDHQSGRYIVSYIPVEVGIYNVHILWNGREIPGCPFHPKVVHAGKVRAVEGWRNIIDSNNHMVLEVNQIKRIELDCIDAGPGQLTAECRGPAGTVPVEIDHRGNGRYLLSFMPRVPGEHYLSIWWADVPLPRTPFIGMARGGGAPAAAHDKVVLTGRGLQEARVNQEAEFVIDGTEAGPGQPDVKLTGVKSDIDVFVQSLGGNKYRCTYVPTAAGAYLLNIIWADRQVRGSPFKVNVVASSDASKVVCTGEGLKMGIMGKEIKSVIDTRRAGPGELTAHCMGPHKVAYCELYDHRDGTFTLNVKPQEAGRHTLQIKYGGEHVPGSPFILKVSGAPDASKVRVSGPGIEHGILATFQSRFIVETRGAGAGQLTVRIRGPKGAFRVEMQRESQKDRTILCRYDPTEVGDYIVHVKWSGEHVPGSPFHVQIFDTQEELERQVALS